LRLGTSLIWRSIDGERNPVVSPIFTSGVVESVRVPGEPTGRQALLELLGLVGVLEHKGIQEPLAADLELDLLGLRVLLDPGSCKRRRKRNHQNLRHPQESVMSTFGAYVTYKKRPSAGRSR